MAEQELDIIKLTIDEIAGTISVEDMGKLYQAIETDPSAHSIWKEIHIYFSNPTNQEAVNRVSESLPLEKLLKKINVRRSPRIYWVSALGAAAAIIAFFLVVPNLLPNGQSNRSSQTKIIQSNRIELELPTGNKIDLSSPIENKSVRGLTLMNTGDGLKYYASDWKSTNKGNAVLRIPAGKDYKIILSDGTEVWLNSSTTFSFPIEFPGIKREVTISGEAYFKVARNAEEPFVVHLQKGRNIKVLGTEFNVNTYEYEKTNVSLVNGSLQVNTDIDSTLLNPGYSAEIGIRNTLLVHESDKYVSTWRNGIFVFHDTKLEEVFKVITRWYGVSVQVDNRNLRDMRYFGIVNRNQPVKELLERIKAINTFEYFYDQDSVIHIR